MRPFIELSGQAAVADFGGGNGALLEVIDSRIREYVGVDFSEVFVRAAEPRRRARPEGAGGRLMKPPPRLLNRTGFPGVPIH